MKKNIIVCLSLMVLTIVCYVVTVKVMQNADKNTSSQSVMTIITENGALAIPMEEVEMKSIDRIAGREIVIDGNWTDETMTFINVYESGKKEVFQTKHFSRKFVDGGILEVVSDSEGNILKENLYESQVSQPEEKIVIEPRENNEQCDFEALFGEAPTWTL